MENKSKELTFADLLEIIFKRKILLAVITLIITIVGTLFLGVVYSNSNAYYTTSFSLDYPGSATLTMPDGSNLKYSDFISQKSLETVKKSDSKYSSIDVVSLSLYDDISISQEIVINSAERKDTVYTITVKSKYFTNKEVAKAFLKDLSTLPINNVKEMVKNTRHDSYLNAYDNSLSFDNKLNFLETQKEYLLSAYDKTITSLGDISINNKSLSTYKQGVENFFMMNSLELLKSEFEREGYAPKNEELVKSYQSEIETLISKKQSNENIIDAIRLEIGKNEYSDKQIGIDRILELLEENVIISSKIETLNTKLSYAKGEITNEQEYLAFTSKLTSFYENVDNFTNEYVENVNTIYEQLSAITFENSSIIKERGGVSIIVAGIASFIVGLLIASFTILILNGIKKKEK